MIEINNQELKDKITENKKLLVVEFFAKWCKYCKALNIDLEEIKENEKFEILQIDVDKETLLAESYNIEIYPTVIFIKDNQIIEKISGVLSKDDCLAVLARLECL